MDREFPEAEPFCRGLAATCAACALFSAGAFAVLRVPPGVALWGAALSAAVGAQWTALSVGNGLCSTGVVLGSVAAGSGVSFLLAVALVGSVPLGIPGSLFGLLSGQGLTLAILLIAVLRALPERADESARLLPSLRDYAALAGAGLAFNGSLWVDKLVAWSAGGETGALHGPVSTLA